MSCLFLPQSVEDIDPVEDDVGKLSTESEVLQEEWDKGGLHSGVGLPKFVMNKVLKTIPVISNIDGVKLVMVASIYHF